MGVSVPNIHYNPHLRDQLLAALVDSSEDAVISLDLQGMIQTWNTGAERLYGYREEEVLGRSAVLLFPPERSSEEGNFLARIAEGESSISPFEDTRIRKDGTRIGVSVSLSPIRTKEGKVTGVSHIARIITEPMRAEAATAQLAAIVESSDDAIISKNLYGIILTWNAAAERIYGYTEDEVRWRHMSILLPPDRIG